MEPVVTEWRIVYHTGSKCRSKTCGNALSAINFVQECLARSYTAITITRCNIYPVSIAELLKGEDHEV